MSQFILNLYYRALSVSNTAVSHVGLEYLLVGLEFLQVLFVRCKKINQDKLCLLLQNYSPSSLKVLDSEFEIPAFANKTLQRPPTSLVSAHFKGNGMIHLKTIQNLFFSNIQTSNLQLRSHVKDADLLQMNDPMILIGQPFVPEQVLDRHREADCIITFEGIKSVLGKFGRTILDLKIDGIPFVDLSYIRSNCPYLKSLVVEFVDSISNLDNNRSLSFPHLEMFRCIDHPNSHTSWGERELAEMLSSPNLRSIMISNCDRLSNRCLQFAFNKHQFEKLESLKLQNCNNLKIEALMQDLLKSLQSL